MKEQSVTDALLREFLLGKLADNDLERIESLFLTDSETRERVLAIEQDLIEDYIEDSLSEEDRERFLLRFAQTDEDRRKLRITKSIKDWAFIEARAPQPAAVTVSVWDRLRTKLGLRPVYIFTIAVAIVIAAVLAIVWLNRQMERRKHFAVEQELAQLNSPTNLRETPPQMISQELRPVTVRSVEPKPELNLSSEIRVIELRLPWIQKERYSTYQAEVRRLDDRESFTIRNLEAESVAGYTIRIRLPAQVIHRGQYQIQLRGIASDGSSSPAEEYTFVVGA